MGGSRVSFNLEWSWGLSDVTTTIDYKPLAWNVTRSNLIDPIEGLTMMECVGTWHWPMGVEKDTNVCVGFATQDAYIN